MASEIPDAYYFCRLFRRAIKTIRTLPKYEDDNLLEERGDLLREFFKELALLDPFTGVQAQGIMLASLYLYDGEDKEAIELLTFMADEELRELQEAEEEDELDTEGVELDDGEV